MRAFEIGALKVGIVKIGFLKNRFGEIGTFAFLAIAFHPLLMLLENVSKFHYPRLAEVYQ